MKNKVAVDLFWASSCNRCQQAKLEVKNTLKQLKNNRLIYRELDVLEEIDYAVEVGVLKTPSIAINGKLIFSSLPSKQNLLSAIEQALINA